MSNFLVVLLTGWYYPDSVGGTEAYVRALAKELQAMGCTVCVAVPSDNGTEREYEHDGVSVFRYPSVRFPSKPEVRGEVPPECIDVFARWIEKKRPSLVHMHSFTRGCGYYHAQRVAAIRIPLVITVHVPSVTCPRGTMMRWGKIPCDGDMQVHRCAACWLQSRGLPHLFAHPVAWVPPRISRWAGTMDSSFASMIGMPSLIGDQHKRVRELFRMADRVIVVSQWLYDVLRLNGVAPEKLTLSRHGLARPQMAEAYDEFRSPEDNRLRIGYVGRFDPVKGIHILVTAIRRLSFAVPVKLHIYGVAKEDRQREYLHFIRKLAEGDERIVFSGELTEDNRSTVFRSFDILAVPSIWLETGPLVVLEAFAAGLPVIGSDAGGIAELVTHGASGMLVKPGDAKAWTQALEELQTRWHRKEWSWRIPPVRDSKQFAIEAMDVYENVLRTRKPSLIEKDAVTA